MENPVVIGSRHFLEDDEKIILVNIKRKLKLFKKWKNSIYVGYDKKLLGTIGFSWWIKKNAN